MSKDNFLQEIFDKVSKHLLTQNERAWNIGNSECKYRIGELKCAAGCLIPDEDYSSEFEGIAAHDLKFFKDSGYSQGELYLIQRLQMIHDKTPVIFWKKDLKNLAKAFNLKFKE